MTANDSSAISPGRTTAALLLLQFVCMWCVLFVLAPSINWPGSLDVPHAWAYLPDLADTFVDLAEHADEHPDFEVLGFAGHTATGTELKAAMEQATGRELRVRSLPWPVIRVLGLVHPTSREIAELSYLWRTLHRIDGQALEEAIAVQQTTPLDQAVGHALEELGMRA